MSAPGQPTIIRKKRRRRKRRPPIFPFVFLLLAVGGAIWFVRWVFSHKREISKDSVPAGYVIAAEVLKQEYAAYYGAPLSEPRVQGAFSAAADAVSKRNAAGATSVLENAVKNAAVPVVFHDLGVGYASLGDYARAADAFREVLARDLEYAATRTFLRDAKKIAPGSAEPYAHEQEPNNDSATANLIALGSPVGGELSGFNDSADYFRVIAPRAPRDRLRIELANHSIRFAPRLRLYDAKTRILNNGEKTGAAGESLSMIAGPPPNSTFYIAISSADSPTGGLYLLSVTPQKAYDAYEPNDDLLASRRIAVGDEISANIMDGEDTDYFSFVSPRKGVLTIELRNQSASLIPLLTTYDNDRHNIGFTQDVRKPGANAHFALNAEKDAIYYVQISSQAATSGAYTLRIE